MQLTTCKHNYKPRLERVMVEESDVFLSHDFFDINDDTTGVSNGNSNGAVNPGETIELGIIIKNYGTATTATNISATLSSLSGMVTIIDSTHDYADLPPGESSSYQYFDFEVDLSPQNGMALPFNLHIVSDEGEWDSYMELTAEAPDMEFLNYVVQDPNGHLDPGDVAVPLDVTITNIGELTGENIEVILDCEYEMISVVQNQSSFGNINPGQNVSGSPFSVSVSAMIVNGCTVDFQLYMTGDNGFSDTTTFHVPVGEISSQDPIGPDDYGYYALDNIDTNYIGYPIYDWLEIDPTVAGHIYNGIDIGLTDFGNEQDDTRLLGLPFDFQYYGEVFDRVSVCSNGWLAFGDMTYYTNFRNWYIPSTFGPYSMVAAFWDDLYLATNPARKVYYYNDTVNHRLIVEWNVMNQGNSSHPDEIFQVILFDPEYYPTETGDGIILFQYLDISNVTGAGSDNHYATVGIKSNDNLSGIQYSYWNDEPPGAANLTDGLAIKFTTNVPVNASPPVIVHTPHENVTEPLDGYDLYAQISGYYPLDNDNMFTYWSINMSGPFTEEPIVPSTSGAYGEYISTIPEVDPGNIVYYYLYAQDIEGGYRYLPANAPNSLYSFMVGPLDTVLMEEAEFESGWTLGVTGDNATSGIWIREDPIISIADNGTTVQPEDDHTLDPGHICFVTGNADSTAPGGTNDVDGGKTTLLSPVYDLSEYDHPIISFYYWYTNNQGLSPNQDYWRYDVTNNNGATWMVVINTTASTPQDWVFYQFWLEDYVVPNENIQMRFIASDEGSGSLVEACVDDISIVNLGTSWGNWEDYEMIAAENITISVVNDEIHLGWLPVAGASSYRIIKGEEPYFAFEEGEFVGEYSDCNAVIERTSAAEFFRIKVIR